jgi:hypothetical protein
MQHAPQYRHAPLFLSMPPYLGRFGRGRPLDGPGRFYSPRD